LEVCEDGACWLWCESLPHARDTADTGRTVDLNRVIVTCEKRCMRSAKLCALWCAGSDALALYLNLCVSRGATNSIPFHAFRRACRFNSWYRLRPTCRAPEKSKDIAACARSFRVRQFAWLIEAPRRSSAIGTEVSAERHKSDCCSTAGEDQEGLRLCGLEGRRSMQ
jgi:hypothetical protein